MASPAKPGTGHRDGCTCVACRRWREATLESARLREHNLAKARMAAAGAAQGRKEVKREAVQARVDASVQHTDRKLAELHQAIEQHDTRTDVYLALRAAGRTVKQAVAEVEAQFANEPINEGSDDVGPEAK